jgi:hypothetical protein
VGRVTIFVYCGDVCEVVKSWPTRCWGAAGHRSILGNLHADEEAINRRDNPRTSEMAIENSTKFVELWGKFHESIITM